VGLKIKIMKKLLLGALLLLSMTSCLQEVQMKATIIDHVVTADRAGDRTYSTIIKTEDGMVEEKIGLGFYVIPKGTKIVTTVYRVDK